MPVEVNGHPLEFDAVVNVDDALNGILQLTQAFEGALKTKSDTTALDILKTKLSELRKQAEDFQSQLSKGGDAESVKNLGDHLAATNTQIKVVQQLLDSLSPEGPKKVTDELVKQNDQSLRLMAQLRLLKQELASMESAGLSGTPDFEQKLKEATELREALRNVNQQLELQSNRVAGIEALGQAFRGIIGGAEAVGGVLGLITGEEGKAEEITKNLIALQTILQGFGELGNVLNKNSPLNVYLSGILAQREALTVATAEQAAVTGVEAAAETAGVAATQAATTAQLSLNAAMLANPVGVLLAAIVALFGAYEIYSHTLGKATDEEARHMASIEALEDAQKKAAVSIAEEEAGLTSLLTAMQSDNFSKEQKLEKLDELRAKYPEYLSNIQLEQILTGQASTAIERQIELLKSRALAQASESVYADKLKDVVEKQFELNDAVKTGGTFWERYLASLKNVFDFGTGGKEDLVKDRTKELQDATVQANGAMDTMAQTQVDLAKTMQGTADAVDVLTQKMEALKNAGLFTSQNSQIFKDFTEQLGQFVKPASAAQAFNTEAFSKETEDIKAEYAKRIAAAKSGSEEQLQIQKDFQLKMLDRIKEDKTLFDAEGNPLQDASGKVVAAVNNELAGILSSLQSTNEQITQKALSNAAAAAQSVVLSLQAIGQAGGNAYFDAQIAAMKKAAAVEVQAAGDNAGQIRQIRAQLALDIYTIDLARQKQTLENERSQVQVQLDQARAGSQQELDLRLSLIDIAAKEELLQAGKNADKIAEITANAAKKKQDMVKQFAIETAETETNIQIAQINTQLAAVADGSDKQLELQKELIDQKAQLSIEDAEKQIKNEQLLQARIAEIQADAMAQKKKADDQYYTNLTQNLLHNLDSLRNSIQAKAQAVTANPFASDKQKFIAEMNAIDAQEVAVQQTMFKVQQQIDAGQGNVTKLKEDLAKLQADLDKLRADSTTTGQQFNSEQISKYAAEIAAVGSAFKSLSSQLTTLNPQLAAFFSQMGQIASTASSIATAAAKGFTDPAADIQAASSMIDTVVNIFVSAATAAKQAKQAVIDFYDAISAGELKTSEDARAAARQRAQQNEKDLKGLKDEFTLLQQQQKDNADQYNKILQQIYQQSFVASTKANTGIFGLPAFINGGASKNTIQELASLAGKSYSDLLDLYNKGQLTDKAKTLFEQLKALSDEGQNIQDALASLQDKLNQTLTGTTSQTIADSIKQGLEQGKRSVADFADSFNQLISQAILSSFEANQIQPAIAEFYKKFAQLSQQSGGNLTQDQITQLRSLYNSDINSFVQQIQQLQQISGTGLSTGLGPDASSLSGAIKGMSEQTAELIAGQFGGLRLTAIDQLNIARQTLDLQSDIQANTANTVSRLDKMIANMDYYFLQKGIKIQ